MSEYYRSKKRSKRRNKKNNEREKESERKKLEKELNKPDYSIKHYYWRYNSILGETNLYSSWKKFPTIRIKFENVNHRFSLFPQPYIKTEKLLDTFKKYSLFIIDFNYKTEDTFFSLINSIQSEGQGVIELSVNDTIFNFKNKLMSLNTDLYLRPLSDFEFIYIKFKLL